MAGPRVRMNWKPVHYGQNNSLLTYSGFCEALLVSQDNPRVNGKFVSGGPFYMVRVKRDLQTGPEVSHTRSGGTWNGTIGPALAGLPTVVRPTASQAANMNNLAGAFGANIWSTESAAIVSPGYFAQGYNRTRPGSAVADIGQFLIELREFPAVFGSSLTGANWGSLGNLRYVPGMLRSIPFRDIPRMTKALIGAFRGLGSEYLNAVFGWQPFVRDLQKIYHLSRDIDKRMAQIVRDNRKGIRRRTTLVDSTSSTSTNKSYTFCPWSAGPPKWSTQRGTETTSVTTKLKVWYVAKYSYYIPDTSSWAWNARARTALFGGLPTPGLLWEVLPFSWMADWFSNMGDVIDNASDNAVDNLVAHYAYVMRHTRQETFTSNSGTWSSLHTSAASIDGGSYNVIGRGLRETKSRLPSMPGLVFFPGGVNEGFSLRQTAILAALGLSRVPA